MAVKSVIFSLLISFSTGAFAAPAHTACRHSEFCVQAAHAIDLLQTLITATDQCFNPKRPDAIQKTKQRLLSLAEKIQAAASYWAAGDKEKVVTAAQVLAKELSSFDASPGFPANMYCETNRKCLEIGFEGNKKYPLCQPVAGDIHQNVQYLSFRDLLDHTLPTLVTMLHQAT